MRFANEYGVCEITTLPGSPQVAVSHGVFIYPEHRGTGKGSINHILRLKRLKEMGYNYVICTVKAGNTPQEHLMDKFGWTKLSGFKSRGPLTIRLTSMVRRLRGKYGTT